MRKKSTELGDSIQEATEKSQEAWDHAASFERIVAKLEGKRIEAQAKEESVRDLKLDLKEMTETDEDLRSYLDQYEERVALYQKEMETQRTHYTELVQAVEELRQATSTKQSEVGKYQAQKDHYEHQLQQRESIVKEVARRHMIRGFDLDITNDQLSEFMDKIARMAREQQATLERVRQEIQEALHGAQKALGQLNERKSALNQMKGTAKSRINANDQKVEASQRDLDAFDIDEGGRALLESRINDIEERLRKAKTAFESASWDDKIAKAEQELHFTDDKKEKLDAELVQGTKEAGDSARLDFLSKELKDRRKGLETMKNAHGEKISDRLGRQWDASNLDRTFQVALDQRIADLRDAELQRDGTQRELEQVESKLSLTRNDLKSKKQECKDLEERLRSTINDEPSEFPDALQSLETSIIVLRQDQSSFKNLEKYYKDCLETANQHNVCRLCKRILADKDKPNFLKHLEKAISRAAQDALIEELEVAEEDLKAMKDLRSDYDEWLRFKDREIPALQSNCDSLEAKREPLLANIDIQDRKVNERQEAKRDFESLTKTVQNISKYSSEIKSFSAQLEELSSRLSQSGKSRGLERIQDDLKAVNANSKVLRSQMTSLSTERERERTSINALELELRDFGSKLNTAVFQLKEKTHLINQIDDLKNLNAEQRQELDRADEELQSIAPEIAKAQAKYDDIAAQGDKKERELQQEASKLTESRNQLKLSEQEINAYIARGGSSQLKKAQGEIDSLRIELSGVEAEQRHITVEIKKIEDQLRNHNETKRSITDNIKFRRDVRGLESVKKEIMELEDHNAELDKDKYEREANKWQMERNRLSAEQASIIGTLKSKDDQLKQLIQDWEIDYKDAAFKYKESHIKVEATKAAIEDLGRYAGALDKAIMKFHSLKMEEINRIIEELWRRTYQGTDVDSILIRSDNEGSKGNKSYNYRVCMVKQDAEMDMRGRCSAGQKVLASIIIRLALAECFGVNCGLIALDEPTTNLDRDNIRALAEALAEIIQVRRAQSNFQLIVITHDEEFLRYMECSEFCDHYYRISRNERQKSIIERQSIAEVGWLLSL